MHFISFPQLKSPNQLLHKSLSNLSPLAKGEAHQRLGGSAEPLVRSEPPLPPSHGPHLLNLSLAKNSLHFPFSATLFLRREDTISGPLLFKLHPPFSFLLHLNIFSPSSPLLYYTLCTTMAGKALVPFVGSISTFDLEGEPSTANRALITTCTEKEVKAMMETPLPFCRHQGSRL
jgi:hypothetical protein